MSVNLSRRSAIQAGLSAAIFPLLGSKDVLAQTSTVTHWNKISITPSSDSNFYALMQQNFPGLLQDDSAATISSLFHILINNSVLSLTALQVEWNFSTPTNSEVAHDVHLIRSGINRWYTGAIPLMNPGAVRLLTPFFCWSPKAYQNAVKPINWQKALARNEATAYRSFHMGSVTHVTMQPINAVWKNEFVSAEPNGSFAREYVATRNGEHDAAYAVKVRLKMGMDQAALDQFLSQCTLPLTSEKRTAVGRRYRQARRRESLLLLNELRNNSFAHFQHTIRKITSKPRTALTLAS